MGQQDVGALGPEELRVFTEALIKDIAALERMLAMGIIESGRHRIGCEQEMHLVDRAWKPFPVSVELLKRLDGGCFTGELGRFNLEINMDPLPFTGDCLSHLERSLGRKLSAVRQALDGMNGEVVLTGVLPTIRKSDLGRENITPEPRYTALSDALARLRRGDYQFQLRGADELAIRHDSVMLEACCTSFQVHYQVGPEEFVPLYNLAQAVTGPLLAAAVNSPVLFGRRLWMETRIPLFQQAIDTRQATASLRERSPRVVFGRQWLRESAVELFREDLARFPVLFGTRANEDALEALDRGEVPGLRALQVHNGTVYRWNRACFGITEGRPHLRIENRVLPAGPSLLDEIANAAFFWGLMRGMPGVHSDITQVMDFDDAQTNFMAAAEVGLHAQFRWTGNRTVAARELILNELLPVARDGLAGAGLDSGDIHRYLGVIEERVASGRTGAAWLLESLANMEGAEPRRALTALTAGIARRQWSQGTGAHAWKPAAADEGTTMTNHNCRIEEAMTTDLVTTRPDESIMLVTHLMDWKRIRHVPVEDDQGRLIGLVSYFEVLRYFNSHDRSGETAPSVASIMNPDPPTAAPETPIGQAVALMRDADANCLVVVKDGQLVGIVTEHDILNLAAELLAAGDENP